MYSESNYYDDSNIYDTGYHPVQRQDYSKNRKQRRKEAAIARKQLTDKN